MVTGQNPPGHYPPDTYPKDTYPLDTYPLDTYPLDTYPLGHIPPGHLPPGHLPPRTYTPQDIYPLYFKMPYLFMHHVMITYCTLKSIYFAGIAFVCDAGAIMLSDILISILLGFYVKILIRIEEGWLTELVTFFIGHYYIHY